MSKKIRTDDTYYNDIADEINILTGEDKKYKSNELAKKIASIPETRNGSYGRDHLDISFSSISLNSTNNNNAIAIPQELINKKLKSKNNTFSIINNSLVYCGNSPTCDMDELIIEKDVHNYEEIIPIYYTKEAKNNYSKTIAPNAPILKESTFYIKNGPDIELSEIAKGFFDGIDTLIFSFDQAPSTATINIQDNVIVGEKERNKLTIYNKNGGGIFAENGKLLSALPFLINLDCSGLSFNSDDPIIITGTFDVLDLTGKIKGDIDRGIRRNLRFVKSKINALVLDYCEVILNADLFSSINSVSMSHGFPSISQEVKCQNINMSYSVNPLPVFVDNKNLVHIDLNQIYFQHGHKFSGWDERFMNATNLKKVSGPLPVGTKICFNCTSLESVDLSGWEGYSWEWKDIHTGVVKSLTDCFKNCPKLKTVYYGTEENLKKIKEHPNVFDDISKITFIAGSQP